MASLMPLLVTGLSDPAVGAWSNVRVSCLVVAYES